MAPVPLFETDGPRSRAGQAPAYPERGFLIRIRIKRIESAFSPNDVPNTTCIHLLGRNYASPRAAAATAGA